MKIQTNKIPKAMISSNQWVVWRYETVSNGKLTKVPYSALTGSKASTINSATWCSFADALLCYKSGHADGIGFVFTKHDDFIGIDWDHCVNPETGVIDQTVYEEVKSIGSYAEFSPSGTGIHVICKGKLPRTDRCRGNNREVYDRGRFFTVTGDHIEGTFDDVFEYLNGSLEHIFDMITPRFEKPTPKITAVKPTQTFTDDNTKDTFIKCTEGFNKTKFKKLMKGDISDYPSASEAELAFCYIVAEHTDNPIIIDYLYRQSGLYRDKWDRVRCGVSYGDATINMAINNRFMRSLRKIILEEEE